MGFVITVQQVGLMFILMLLGLFGARKGWISGQAQLGMTNVLVYFVTPCVIIQAFHRRFDLAQLHDLGIVGIVDLIVFLTLIALAHVLYRKVRDPLLRRDLRFSAVYPNAGFLGIPLVQALLGADGVFYAVLFVVVFNLFVWTHGWSLFSQGTGEPLKQLISNPAIPSVLIGIAIFVSSVRLPGIVVDGLGYLAAMNAPLSMLVVGASLAGVAWRTFATDRWAWVATGVRNLAIPLIAVLALWAVPLPVEARLAILIPLACPVAAFLVMFAVMHDADTTFPTRLVCLSTLVSLVTLPATLSLAYALW